ncbi:MAG: hypothetical protein A3J28_05880 [Acidobacteria bacterium RIFCSPLOWO2_12_FULL_60_22]|nr:MAG: hypothetical protein A3J28_05880 [Acidobacteria bacterium RIFCSPLOWO2_12_FULL_60_22]
MRSLISILTLATLWQGGALWAQLATVNELGLSWGHLHVTAPDREKEAKAWITLGGGLGYNLSGNIPITFPGIVILLRQREVTGGSAGAVVDHVAFRVPDLEASMAKWKGLVTWWKQGNWGLKPEPGTKPGQGFVTTPGGVKIEILEDKSLQVPIVYDHAHFYVPESRLQETQAWYTKMFGAKPVRGEANTLSMPGGMLVFSKSDAPAALNVGRSLDHIGFNALSAESLRVFTKGLEEKGAKFERPPESSSMGMTSVLDNLGMRIEITKAQGGYFDLKQLDAAFHTFDEGGRRQGDPPRQQP